MSEESLRIDNPFEVSHNDANLLHRLHVVKPLLENLKDSKPNTVSSEKEQNTVLSGKRTKPKLKRHEMLGTFRMKFRILKVTCPININRNIVVRESVLTMIVVWYVHAVRINNYPPFFFIT